MWIRSQDRTELIDITGKRVNISRNFSGGASILVDSMSSNNNGFSDIGQYESKERAIEVLDEIEKTLVNMASSDEIIGKTRIYREVVFEMPEK